MFTTSVSFDNDAKHGEPREFRVSSRGIERVPVYSAIIAERNTALSLGISGYCDNRFVVDFSASHDCINGEQMTIGDTVTPGSADWEDTMTRNKMIQLQYMACIAIRRDSENEILLKSDKIPITRWYDPRTNSPGCDSVDRNRVLVHSRETRLPEFDVGGGRVVTAERIITVPFLYESHAMISPAIIHSVPKMRVCS